MRTKRLANDMRIVTRFTAQQSFPNENVDFCFAQLDHQAAQPMPPAFPVQAHAWRSRSWRRRA
jgi:hypothetical protein